MSEQQTAPDAHELTYPLRTASRLTGLSAQVLRAWERRYGVVDPVRTPGGTRRYTAGDIERLKRLKAAVDAGHRIGQVANLGLAELEALIAAEPASEGPSDRIEEVISALERLDGVDAQRLLALQLSALGGASFARQVALPLMEEIGERWANDQLAISAEHMATGVLRSLLGSALTPTAMSAAGPPVVFATPSGERHELGLLMAALVALGAGANPVYLGLELPVEDVLEAAEVSHAAAVALSIVTMPQSQAERVLAALRGGLPDDVALWVGGVGGRELEMPERVQYFERLEPLEQAVQLLALAAPTASAWGNKA